MYWLPKPNDAASRAGYAETVCRLAEWLRKTLRDTPKRSAPCIMTDLNDRMCIRSEDEVNQAVMGDLFPEQEGLAPSLFVQRHSEGGGCGSDQYVPRRRVDLFQHQRYLDSSRLRCVAAPTENVAVIGLVPGPDQNWNPDFN